MSLPASADSLELAMLVSVPEGAPRGVFQLVHGMCEHKERYIPFMEFLTARGFVCVIHDHRGHGATARSADELGYFGDGGWQALVEDIRIVCDWARAQWPGLDYTLFGHSMGSMAVRSFAKRYDDRIDRLFVCGCPSDNPAKGLGKFLAGAYCLLRGGHYRPKFIQTLAFGSFNKPFADEGWPVAWVCSDPQTLKEYHEDPLCMFQFTANGFRNLFGLMQDCYSRKGWTVAKPQMPVHFIVGGDDPCCGTEKALAQAVEAMRRAGYRSVDLKVYPGMRHEILNETGRQQVWDDILAQLPR